MGDVMGDVNSRRGRIEGMEARGNAQVVTSDCSTCLKCLVMQQTLRSRTQGRGTILNGHLIIMMKFRKSLLKKSLRKAKVNS